MTKPGFSPWRWAAQRSAQRSAQRTQRAPQRSPTFGAAVGCAVALGLALAAGCSSQSTSGTGGEGGHATTSTTSSSTTSSSTSSSGTSSSTTTSSTGSSGGTGGAGGAQSTSSSTSASIASSAAGSSSGTGGAGTSSSSSSSGTGGMGGGFEHPVGSADYPAEVEQNNLSTTANPLATGTKGFTASIYPQGDVDVFSFTITQGGTTVAVKTSDGTGGCPAGAQTYVRVFDASANLLAGNKFPIAGCANLTPTAYPKLLSLPTGTYYVHVEDGGINPIPLYILDIKLSPPGCGDGILQVGNGEQCDDNNNTSGDGCSATCTLESGNYFNETEPNNTQATGNLLDGHDGVVAQLSPASDVDWFTFNVTTPGSSVYAEVTDGNGGCPTNFDSVLDLYSPSQTILQTDDDSGVAYCSKIDPAVYPAATNLPVGLYALEVTPHSSGAVVPFYVLKVKVSPPGCGDGVLQPGEQCDDSNMVSGDLCSSTCQFENTYIPETEVNDSQALANHFPTTGADGFIASIQPAGDLDYFSFDVTTPGSSVVLATTDGLSGCPTGFDSTIYLYNPAHVQLATNDDGPVGKCSRISPITYPAAGGLPVGTYTVRVERTGNTLTQAQYVLLIKVSPPGCGDGIVQPGEQCDDGNTTSGDGCSATCVVEPPYEIEPNGSTATATPLWPGTSMWKGAINPVGDRDYYTFTLTAISSVTLATHAVDSPTTCGFDTEIHLLDHTGAQIVQNDDGGIAPCSKLDPVHNSQVKNMAIGTYYVWVQRFNDALPIPAYQLDLTIQ